MASVKIETEHEFRVRQLDELLRGAPPRLSLSPGVWYWQDGRLHCVGEVEIERWVVAGHDLAEEIAKLRRRIDALERRDG
jgi:hypothetical protein